MGQFCAVRVWMAGRWECSHDRSFHTATNGRNECTMASFSRLKRKFRLTKRSKIRPKPSTPKRNKPGAVRKPGLDFWIGLGLLVAVLAMYGQVRSHAFVSFDDPIYVTENPQVRSGLTSSGTGFGLSPRFTTQTGFRLPGSRTCWTANSSVSTAAGIT